MTIQLSEKKLCQIIKECVNKIISENYPQYTNNNTNYNGQTNYSDYYRRFNKLKGIAKNQGNLDAQKQELTNNYKNAVSDFSNPNYDGGLNASNRLMQHQFKQLSANTYNRSNNTFEKLKKYYNPQNFRIQVPQQYINAYNTWVNLETQYLQLYQIYTNEYSRVSGRLNIVKNRNRLSMEFRKLNNFYVEKIEPLHQEVTKYFNFLNMWSQYFYKLSNQNANNNK